VSDEHGHDDADAIWYEPQTETPPRPEHGFGLFFNFISDHGDEPSIALAASFRLPGRFMALYGGRINGATQVVVVDARCGAVHYRAAEPRTGIELFPYRTLPENLPSAVGGNVNVDVTRHLHLAPERRAYHVFLWLDEHVSRVATFETPGPDPESDAGTFAFTAAPRGPQRGDAAHVTLRLAPSAAGSSGRGAVVEGSVYLPGPAVTGEQIPLTVLGLCDQTHDLGGTIEPLPATLERATEWTFRIPVAHLMPRYGRPEVLHIVALVGGALSGVLQVPLDERRN
jgi:hypothetical protein